MFSKFLATIKTDVPVQLDMDALKKRSPTKKNFAVCSKCWSSVL